MRLILTVHLASLHEPRLEEFPVGGGSNKLKVRLGIRNLAALPVLAKSGSQDDAAERPLTPQQETFERRR